MTRADRQVMDHRSINSRTRGGRSRANEYAELFAPSERTGERSVSRQIRMIARDLCECKYRRYNAGNIYSYCNAYTVDMLRFHAE